MKKKKCKKREKQTIRKATEIETFSENFRKEKRLENYRNTKNGYRSVEEEKNICYLVENKISPKAKVIEGNANYKRRKGMTDRPEMSIIRVQRN